MLITKIGSHNRSVERNPVINYSPGIHYYQGLRCVDDAW